MTALILPRRRLLRAMFAAPAIVAAPSLMRASTVCSTLPPAMINRRECQLAMDRILLQYIAERDAVWHRRWAAPRGPLVANPSPSWYFPMAVHSAS